MLMRVVVLLGLGIAGMVLVIVLARQIYERRRARARLDRDAQKCKCGYILRGLALPRCPECGRVVGFDKTFQELGVRPEELRGTTPDRKQ